MKGVKGGDKRRRHYRRTKTMFTLGVRSESASSGMRSRRGSNTSGFSQETDYTMPSFSVDGKREIKYHQVRIP